jgi:hypothetical protein
MVRSVTLWSTLALIGAVSAIANVQAKHDQPTLAVTMTNDANGNQIQVYDAAGGTLIQTLATHGKGGVNGNARGVRQYQGDLIAAVNNGSNTVALFRRTGNGLKFDRVVPTSSAPVSIDFANDHMYVAGATTIDSYALHGNAVWMDGTATLELANGSLPPAGSTAQVGVVSGRRALVTLKADPDPGTVDVVALRDGAVDGGVSAVSAPAGTLTPFGFAVYHDGSAVITLAHSNHDGLFRDGAFTAIIASGQAAPCWMTRVGKYLYTANTGSHTISRLLGTGANVFIDAPVAANIVTGGAPADIDADAGVLGVIDRGAGPAHLSLFTYDRFGTLAAAGHPINLVAPNANGIAIVPSSDRD